MSPYFSLNNEINRELTVEIPERPKNYVQFSKLIKSWIKKFHSGMFAEKVKAESFMDATSKLSKAISGLVSNKYTAKLIHNKALVNLVSNKEIPDGERALYESGLSSIVVEYITEEIIDSIWNPSRTKDFIKCLGRVTSETSDLEEFKITIGTVKVSFWVEKETGYIILDQRTIKQLGAVRGFSSLLKYTYRNINEYGFFDKKSQSGNYKIIDMVLRENMEEYLQLEQRLSSLISFYFSTVGSKDDITINFMKLGYNGFEKESTIKYPKSGLDIDVRDLYGSGHSIVIKRSDLFDGTFKAKMVSIIFYMMFTKSYAFMGRFLRNQEGLFASVSPNGKILNNYQLLSLAEGKKTLPLSKSKLNFIGQVAFGVFAQGWNLKQIRVFQPALSCFVSTKSKGYLSRAERGGYDDLEYGELKRKFCKLFGFTGDIIVDLV